MSIVEKLFELSQGTFSKESTVGNYGATQVRLTFDQSKLESSAQENRRLTVDGCMDASSLIQVRFENSKGQRVELPHEADTRVVMFTGSLSYPASLFSLRVQTGGSLRDSWRLTPNLHQF